MILSLSLVLSVGGVFVAAFYLQDSDQGGRGGALGTAISFFALFISRERGSRTLDALVKKPEEIRHIFSALRGTSVSQKNDFETLAHRADAITVQFRAGAADQQLQNMFIASSGGIATLFWGFGDIWAKWVMAHAGIITIVSNASCCCLSPDFGGSFCCY